MESPQFLPAQGRDCGFLFPAHEDLFQAWQYYSVIQGVVNESLEKAELVCCNSPGQAVNSVMCLPLSLNEQKD